MITAIEREAITTPLVPRERRDGNAAPTVGAVLLGFHFRDSGIVTELGRSLTSFLYISPNEFFRIRLQYLVNFIENGIDVFGHFLVAFGDLGVDRGLDLVGLLARTRRLLLPAGVPGSHAVLRCCSWP